MKLSVVIPTLDEASEITEAIQSAVAPEVEILVVDGGSRDDTVVRASQAGARIAHSEPGRALQLQAGIAETEGEVVVFLHADSRLPPGWDSAVRRSLLRAVQDGGHPGGAFRFRFGGEWSGRDDVALRVVEWGARLRGALFSLPYGDQAIFVRRSVLMAIGGVPPVPIMEDLDLVKAMKAHGPVVMLEASVATSPRRYLERGVYRTMFRHWLAALAWGMGIDRQRLATWYGK